MTLAPDSLRRGFSLCGWGCLSPGSLAPLWAVLWACVGWVWASLYTFINGGKLSAVFLLSGGMLSRLRCLWGVPVRQWRRLLSLGWVVPFWVYCQAVYNPIDSGASCPAFADRPPELSRKRYPRRGKHRRTFKPRECFEYPKI